ncbi:MAG TPA: hypothetical protein PKM73_05800 [Verrucomicrobiota bacterium]|nr:hypothetical protein [Verrucomicrobiota bacterium]
MKKRSSSARDPRPAASSEASGAVRHPRIHPVIIYPYRPTSDYSDLEQLYGMVSRLDAEKEKYARPVTVMDRKTFHAQATHGPFLAFREKVVQRHSDLIDAWCVDTCQMWYTGLGAAYERGAAGDVYWLIPGDFNYGTAVGREVLSRLHDLPEIVLELDQDLCVGEVTMDPNCSKHVIDTYGTFALLYTWFPAEAREIRQVTERPRSEFFALHHRFLHEALCQRWYAYEQTMVLLVQAVVSNKRVSRFSVGNISDLPEGRESLAAAIEQVERTERVLKSLWRDRHGRRSGWIEQYRVLESQSDAVCRASRGILQNLLR